MRDMAKPILKGKCLQVLTRRESLTFEHLNNGFSKSIPFPEEIQYPLRLTALMRFLYLEPFLKAGNKIPFIVARKDIFSILQQELHLGVFFWNKFHNGVLGRELRH